MVVDHPVRVDPFSVSLAHERVAVGPAEENSQMGLDAQHQNVVVAGLVGRAAIVWCRSN